MLNNRKLYVSTVQCYINKLIHYKTAVATVAKDVFTSKMAASHSQP